MFSCGGCCLKDDADQDAAFGGTKPLSSYMVPGGTEEYEDAADRSFNASEKEKEKENAVVEEPAASATESASKEALLPSDTSPKGETVPADDMKKPSEDSTKKTPSQFRDFHIHIERGTGGLGLEAEVEHGTGSLLIIEVREGPILLWNKAHPEAEVRAGDLVYGVNGTSGKATEIVKVMKGAESMDLTIRRRESE